LIRIPEALDSAISSPIRLNSAKKILQLQIGLLEISIALDGRGAKLTVERELTKSNLVSAKAQTVPMLTPTGAE